MKGRGSEAGALIIRCWAGILFLLTLDDVRSGPYYSSSVMGMTMRPFPTASTVFSLPYVGDYEETEEASWETGEDHLPVLPPMGPSQVPPHLLEPMTMAATAATTTIGPRQQGQQEEARDIPLEFADILPANRRSYDKMEPPKKDGKPTTVFFHVTVMSLDSIDESSMTYAADIFFSQTWQDYRLRFPDNLTVPYRLLPVSWLNSMWRPDSFFKNAKKVTFQDVTIPNHYIWLYKDKSILYMVKLTLILSCSMNFHLYPHDTQQCAMKIESLSHTTDDLVFVWDVALPLAVDDRIELPQLDLVSNITGDCTQVYSTGNFTCLEVILSFRRRLGYYLFHTYIPTCLIVVMSWISFWIRPEAVPARVTLGVTSLLTLHTQHANSQKGLPPVSYIKAIDVFMSGCTVFVFLSLMEYALVNILMGDVVDGEESAMKKGIKSMFVTTAAGGNGRSTPGQQMEVIQQGGLLMNNSRCLRHGNIAAPILPAEESSGGASPAIIRSQSLLLTHPLQPQQQPQHCRHAAEIHHSSPPDRNTASPAADIQIHQNPISRSSSGSRNQISIRTNESVSRTSPLQQIPTDIVETCGMMDDPPPPPPAPPPTPSVLIQRKKNDNGLTGQQSAAGATSLMASSENGRLPLISSLHSTAVTGQNKEGRPSDQQPGPFSSSAPPGRTGYYSNPKASLNLQQLRRSRAITVDRVSRSLFPLSFTILNIAYWCVFLNSQEDDVKIPV